MNEWNVSWKISAGNSMLPPESMGLFAVASLLLAISPGPDNVFVITQSAVYGRSAGLFVVCGLCTGILMHTTLVILGVTAVIAATPVAFTGLKMLGAGYLLYLAWQTVVSRATLAGEAVALEPRQYYLRGVIMNASNPKVGLFFLAFLPQFVEPHLGRPELQLATLGLIFLLCTVLVFGSVAVFAGYLGDYLRRSDRVQRILNWTVAAVFVALAIRLLIA